MYFLLSVDHRREAKRPLWLHRTSMPSIYFTVFFIVLAVIIGLFLPHMESLTFDEESGVNSIEVTAESLDVKRVLKALVYICWLFKFYPLAILNFCRGRTLGLNINFVMWAGISALCNFLKVIVVAASNRKMEFLSEGERDLDDEMGALVVIYVIFNLLIVLVLIWQSYRYDLSAQAPSSLALGTLFMTAFTTGIYYTVNMVIIDDEGSRNVAINRWLFACELLSICTSIWKFVPQIQQNRKYSVAIGQDMCSFLLEGFGALCLMLLILLDDRSSTVNLQHGQVETYSIEPSAGQRVRMTILSATTLAGVLYLCKQTYAYWQMPLRSEIKRDFNNLSVMRRRENNARRQQTAGTKELRPLRPLLFIPLCWPPLILCYLGKKCLGQKADCVDAPEDLEHQGMHSIEVDVPIGKDAKPQRTSRKKWECRTCAFDNETENIFCARCEASFENVVHSVKQGGGLTVGSSADSDLYDQQLHVISYPVDHMEEI